MTKTVLITGASSGIGRATAEAFLDDDWRVWATAPDEAAVADLGEAGCETAELDVTNARECERVVADVVESAGRIDCLVTTTGAAPFGAVEDLSTAELETHLDANLLGPHRLVREVLPHMRARENGTIVTVTSAAGRLGLPGLGGTAASTFGIEGLTDALRAEVEPHGIDVSLVEPGPMASADGEETEAPERDSGAYGWLDRARTDSRLAGVQDALSVTPGAVALTVRDAANASDPEPHYPVGGGAELLLRTRHVPARIRTAVLGLVRKLTS